MITLTLQKVEDCANGTKTFVFDKPENFTFRAGQYVAFKIDNLIAPDYRAGVRSLSICSAPSEPFMAFTVRESESGFKKTLWAMEPGATASITPPIGKFVLDPEDMREVVFLIGGVGITPVRSMLIEEQSHPTGRKMTLLYANRTLGDAPFQSELRELELPNLRYIDVLSQEEAGVEHENEARGYINEELLRKEVDNPEKCVYYMVGSPAFLGAMEEMLKAMSIPEDQCHKDPFTGMESHNQTIQK